MVDLEFQSSEVITAAVVSDTHIPDRVKHLHPGLLPALRSLHPNYILHAGDISHQRVLDELRELAPVFAVRGNRDFLFSRSLPVSQELSFNGIKVYLTHGHINPYHYWRDKLENLIYGYRFDRYYRRLLSAAPGADVILFGHSHHAENRVRDAKLFFNPGSCSVAEKPDYKLSFGIIHFYPDGEVKGEIIPLE